MGAVVDADRRLNDEVRERHVIDALRLLQFGDSMFPVGAFSFSNGLESAIELDIVHDRATLRDFVRAATRVTASGDGIALLHAYRAALDHNTAALRQADRAVYVRRLNEEMRTMSVRMGRKLGEAAAVVVPGPAVEAWLGEVTAGTTPGTYPAALGLVMAELGLAEEVAFSSHQYGVAVMMVGAAVRLMRLHHLDAQAVLFEVNGDVAAEYQRVRTRDLDDMSTYVPMTDILAAVHVRAHVRMFMN